MARKVQQQVEGKVRAIGYIRVSTDKQAEQGHSLDAQRAKLEAYASLYDLELVEVIVDEGASAKNLDRPELPRVLSALAEGRADAVLVTKLDRLTRSVRDLGELMERSQREGWSIRSVGEQLDTASAAGRLVVNILGAVSQWEREAIGERTSAAMQQMKREGLHTGGKVPFGYDCVEGKLVINEAQQTVIAEMRRRRANGESLRTIASWLTEEGHLPASGRWHAETVKTVIERD
jgi:DNA invertase Pin-like site-specific DNA recombinase